MLKQVKHPAFGFTLTVPTSQLSEYQEAGWIIVSPKIKLVKK